MVHKDEYTVNVRHHHSACTLHTHAVSHACHSMINGCIDGVLLFNAVPNV